MDSQRKIKVINISASCVASFRYSRHPDNIRSAIENTLKMNDPEGFAKHGRWNTNKWEGVDLEDGKHCIRIANSHRGHSVVKKLQQEFINTRMCAFGYEEETKSRDGVSRLLAIKKWSLTKFQDKRQYTKKFPCELNDGEVTLMVSGRLDGECAHRGTYAVVEIKNRLNGLIFKPRNTEECQVRLYMELTNYEHAFLFERHVSSKGGDTNGEIENISVVPFTKKDRPNFIKETFGDKNFKKNLEKVLKCLNDEQEFADFFTPQVKPPKEQRRNTLQSPGDNELPEVSGQAQRDIVRSSQWRRWG